MKTSRLQRVLKLKSQAKKRAAEHLADAQQSYQQGHEQFESVTNLTQEYADEIRAPRNTGTLLITNERAFYSKLSSLCETQKDEVDRLKSQLELVQQRYLACRSDETLLEGLVSNRDAVHEYQVRKKQERSLVYRGKTKL